MTFAYDMGRSHAAREFGVRVAFDMNVPAERLAARLSALASSKSAPASRKENRLDRPTRWGGPVSPFATGVASHDYSGIGRDGAAV